jgi:hypothetical protein
MNDLQKALIRSLFLKAKTHDELREQFDGWGLSSLNAALCRLCTKKYVWRTKNDVYTLRLRGEKKYKQLFAPDEPKQRVKGERKASRTTLAPGYHLRWHFLRSRGICIH